ncbi:MAG: hypothetical protein CMJ81_13105 [Planctomycetaceae bacterium]|nr:hypothetical protein [Planctomycetaceae bacterium]MBP60602.1 hypothetical protein [Planctomycetaceae bacterium]
MVAAVFFGIWRVQANLLGSFLWTDLVRGAGLPREIEFTTRHVSNNGVEFLLVHEVVCDTALISRLYLLFA